MNEILILYRGEGYCELVKNLQHEAIEKCLKRKNTDHIDIMKTMIEKAYHEGRKQEQREMSYETRQRSSELILAELAF